MVLCGASILNAFLRGEPNQIVVSSVEASRVLEQAAPACQQCLDQLGEWLPRSAGNKASGGRGTRTSVHLPLHIRYGLVTQGIFEVVVLSEIVSWPAALGCHGVVTLGEASWGCRSSYENITVFVQITEMDGLAQKVTPETPSVTVHKPPRCVPLCRR